MNSAEIDAALSRIAVEWDKAEKLIKTAEFTRSEVVIASVNELRYAGRRLVDAIRAAEACRADPTCVESQEKYNRYVSETLAFCHRALHDAVDAIVLHVRAQINEYETTFGKTLIAEKFPNIVEIWTTLRTAEKLIILSREDRMKRSEDYDDLATKQIPSLLSHCDLLEANRELLLELATAKLRAETKDSRRFWLALLGGGLIAFAAACGGIIFDRTLNKSDQDDPNAAAEASPGKG